MRAWKKIVLAAFGVLVAGAAVFLVPTLWFTPWSIDHFYTRVFLQFALRRPMLLSSLRILEPMGIDFHNDDLDDFSVAFMVDEARRVDRELRILRSYDRAKMTDSDRLSADVLEWFMADAQEANRFMFHDYPVNQFEGLQSALPDFMVNTHQIHRERDARNYIARLSKFGAAIDQIIDGLDVRRARGIVPPRFVIRRVLEQENAFIATPPTLNVLYTHFEEEAGKLADLTPARRQALSGDVAGTIETIVYPAYRRLIACLTQMETTATDDDGVWKLPDGPSWYAHCLHSSTTTDMTADEIHRLGLREVARLQDEMRVILSRQGEPADDLASAMNRLNKDPRFLYPDTDEGRNQVLADYQRIIDEIDAGLGALFDARPSIGVKVERVPRFREATSAGAYYQAAPLDGSRPGVFFVNLRSIGEVPRFAMRTLAYHEAIPGHHFQIGIAQQLKGLPFFRRIIPFAAYGEGWALYAERLAAEHGFQQDPYDRLGYLTAQLFRAVRLVVDTGIHHMKWTREQAIQYMLTNTGMPETDVVAEIERYIVWPGQACAYMVGELKILELRARAQARRGPKFDIRKFHSVVLSNGALPLQILERLVDRWIESQIRES